MKKENRWMKMKKINESSGSVNRVIRISTTGSFKCHDLCCKSILFVTGKLFFSHSSKDHESFQTTEIRVFNTVLTIPFSTSLTSIAHHLISVYINTF